MSGKQRRINPPAQVALAPMLVVVVLRRLTPLFPASVVKSG